MLKLTYRMINISFTTVTQPQLNSLVFMILCVHYGVIENARKFNNSFFFYKDSSNERVCMSLN